MILEAIYVSPHELHEYWPVVREGLEKVQKHGEGWIPEDVYSAIKTGQAALHMFYEGSELRAFVVTAQINEASGPVLFVWALYSYGQNQDGHAAVVQQLDEWAVSIGAKKIRYHSPRKGWEKVGEKIGFYPTATVYEREVG